jgi:hypothetical protein
MQTTTINVLQDILQRLNHRRDRGTHPDGRHRRCSAAAIVTQGEINALLRKATYTNADRAQTTDPAKTPISLESAPVGGSKLTQEPVIFAQPAVPVTRTRSVA